MPASSFSSPSGSQNSSSTMRSPQMRKEALRNVSVNVQALENNVNTKTVENLEAMITEVDIINQESTLEDKIKDQGEVLLDSAIMEVSSRVLNKCTFSLSKDIDCYDPLEMADKIRTFMCRMPDTGMDDDVDWSLFGNEVMKLFRRTAAFKMFLGTLRPIPKKEVIRRKYVKEAQAPTKRPENVVVVDKVEESIEKTVVGIKKIIGNYQKQYKAPLDFFSLVLHPTDFGKTIENILHISFLIRDGIVKFSTDEDGIPHVLKSVKEEAEKAKRKVNIQNVISLNMKQWRELVQAYNITEPMINIEP